MYAKKSLGQHFLKSERALNKIVEAGEIKKSDVVLEIGPGTGTLTERLLTKANRVIAVEKDDALYEILENKFPELELVHGDILDFTPPKTSYKLVANIPYNITGAILEKFLSAENQPERIVLLVQKEVAERIIARNNKASILSLSVKAYGKPKFVEKVLAGSFAPAPRVDSAILLIEDISKEFFDKFSERDFFRLVKTGFSAKRKKLSSNLSKIFPKNRTSEVFALLKIGENTRAEDVSLAEWGQLASLLCV